MNSIMSLLRKVLPLKLSCSNLFAFFILGLYTLQSDIIWRIECLNGAVTHNHNNNAESINIKSTTWKSNMDEANLSTEALLRSTAPQLADRRNQQEQLQLRQQKQQQQQQQQQHARATDSYMRRHMLDNNKSNATCNDGTRPGYYMRKNDNSNRWLIFLEGGWHCFNEQSCQRRWEHEEHLMTSAHWPELKNGAGILSSNPEENPYWWNANHVFIPYCSSDSWSGDVAAKAPGEFSFMGSRIIEEVINSLLVMDNGLGQGRFVLFAGSSAGAVGVMVNLDRVSDMIRAYVAAKNSQLPVPPDLTSQDPSTGGTAGGSVKIYHEIEIRGLADSGWFLDNEPYDFLENQTPSIVSNGASRLKKSMSPRNTPTTSSSVPGPVNHNSQSSSSSTYRTLKSTHTTFAPTTRAFNRLKTSPLPSSNSTSNAQAPQTGGIQQTVSPVKITSSDSNDDRHQQQQQQQQSTSPTNNNQPEAHDEQPCDESHACAPIQSIKLAMRLWNGRVPEACRQQYQEEPWRCFFGYRTYATMKTPLFVVQWLFDEAQLVVDNVGQPNTASQWDYIYRMSAQIRDTLESVPTVFAPSCFAHIILNRRDWLQTRINGLSLAQALNYWEDQKIPQRTITNFTETNQSANLSRLNNFLDLKSSSYHNPRHDQRHHQHQHHHSNPYNNQQQAYYQSQVEIPNQQPSESSNNNSLFNNNKLSAIIQSDAGHSFGPNHLNTTQPHQNRRGKNKNSNKNKKRNNKNSRNKQQQQQQQQQQSHSNNNITGSIISTSTTNQNSAHLSVLLNNNVRNINPDLTLDHLMNKNDNQRHKRATTEYDGKLESTSTSYDRGSSINDEVVNSRNANDNLQLDLWLVDSCTRLQCNQGCPSIQNV